MKNESAIFFLLFSPTAPSGKPLWLGDGWWASETQQEIIHQLTDLDLIKEICKPENTKTKEGFLLCREMTCFIYSRGIDSETSGKQCEEISNISNTITMIEYCKEQTDAGSMCYEVFYRRK